jgi:hypothetical protein
MELVERERIVGKALRDAFDWMSEHHGVEPDGHRVVLHVLGTVVDVERRKANQPKIVDRSGRPVRARPAWCNEVIRTPAEHREAAQQRRLDVVEDGIVTDDQIALAKAVNSIFYVALPSRKTREKDWLVLKEIAGSDGTEREIAKGLGVHHSAISRMKSAKGRAADIWNAVGSLMPPRIKRGRVWRSAA